MIHGRRTGRPFHAGDGPAHPRAVTLDYWDTLFDGSVLPERLDARVGAMRRLFRALGREIDAGDMLALYRESGRESDRWWREEHRGYRTEERISWMLRRAALPVDGAEAVAGIADAARAVDDALLDFPPPLLAGVAEAIRALAERYPLVIVSDTGFASARAQERLLAGSGLAGYFLAQVYSADVGFAKPRPEIFAAAVAHLGVPAADILHVGDNERTDVGGAIAFGMRAVRIDLVRAAGDSAGEHVAATYPELVDYLLKRSVP